jgi:putative FmdB family regulatory protein
MPTYAYRGDRCDHEFEVRQSFSEDPITECLTCGQPVHRVIHPAGIVFKGTGWYITDSRPTKDASGGIPDATKATDKKSDTPAGSAAAESSTSKSDATPAATPAASTATATATKVAAAKDA